MLISHSLCSILGWHRKTISCDCGYFWLQFPALPFYIGFRSQSVSNFVQIFVRPFSFKLHGFSDVGFPAVDGREFEAHGWAFKTFLFSDRKCFHFLIAGNGRTAETNALCICNGVKIMKIENDFSHRPMLYRAACWSNFKCDCRWDELSLSLSLSLGLIGRFQSVR